MTNQKYNGWTNRETWVINLWIGDTLQEIVNDYKEEFEELSVDQVAGMLQDTVETMFETELDNMSGMLKDMLYISEVDYFDLAESYLSE